MHGLIYGMLTWDMCLNATRCQEFEYELVLSFKVIKKMWLDKTVDYITVYALQISTSVGGKFPCTGTFLGFSLSVNH